jgi:hypothetical protein
MMAQPPGLRIRSISTKIVTGSLHLHWAINNQMLFQVKIQVRLIHSTTYLFFKRENKWSAWRRS